MDRGYILWLILYAMANMTLEVASETAMSSLVAARYAASASISEVVKCNDCGKDVPLARTYHSPAEDKYYCLGNCLTEHLDSVA